MLRHKEKKWHTSLFQLSTDGKSNAEASLKSVELMDSSFRAGNPSNATDGKVDIATSDEVCYQSEVHMSSEEIPAIKILLEPLCVDGLKSCRFQQSPHSDPIIAPNLYYVGCQPSFTLMPKAKGKFAHAQKISFCPDCGKQFSNKTNILQHMNQPSNACSSVMNGISYQPYASQAAQVCDLFNQAQLNRPEEISEWECDEINLNMLDNVSTHPPCPEAVLNIEYYPGVSSKVDVLCVPRTSHAKV